jgi:hypothetical protein
MEQWRDIPGYEGIYQVSNMGRIRTCEGKTTYTERHGVRHWQQRTIKQKLVKHKRGRTDARVDLWKDGKSKTFLVARLVGMAWCDGFGEDLTINHINGNSLDNSASNLEWISNAENIRKGFETGLYANVQLPVSLTCGDRVEFFMSMADASRYLGRSHGYVSDCLKENRLATALDGQKYSVRM